MTSVTTCSIDNRHTAAPPDEKFQLLQAQLNQELAASQSYLALAGWADAHHFPGMANFFRQQSLEERQHALRLFDYLLDRGQQPRLSASGSPRHDFDSLLEVAQFALALERENTRGIHAAYRAALDGEDFATQVAMQWFVSEQVEEERWAEELVAQVQIAGCAGALTRLDGHFGKRSSASG